MTKLEGFLNKVICGDCLEVMKELPNECVDLVVTSPPYDNIRTYCGNWVVDLHATGIEIFRLLKEGGIAVMVIQDQTKNFAKSLTSFRTIVDWCDNIGFRLFECLIYQRSGTPGAWWNKRFRVDHEYMPVFLKGNKPKYFNKEHLKIPAIQAGIIKQCGGVRTTKGEVTKSKIMRQPDYKCRGTIWNYESAKARKNKIKNQHPATFPDEIPQDHILCWTLPGDIILDPFLGSGTTAVAALNTGRFFIGIEKEPKYVEMANKRIQEAMQQKQFAERG